MPSQARDGRILFSVAALNLTATSADIRLRSFTSIPCVFAHSRTSVVFSRLADARRPFGVAHRGAVSRPPRDTHIARQCVPQRLGILD
jgi:hypothetical protein